MFVYKHHLSQTYCLYIVISKYPATSLVPRPGAFIRDNARLLRSLKQSPGLVVVLSEISIGVSDVAFAREPEGTLGTVWRRSFDIS